MNFLGIKIIPSPAIASDRMLVFSGYRLYGFDLAGGKEFCVKWRINEFGQFEIVERCDMNKERA